MTNAVIIMITENAGTTTFSTATMTVSKSFDERRGEKKIVEKYQLNKNGPHDDPIKKD